MRVKYFIWDRSGWNIEHIASHDVLPEECESVLDGKYRLFRGRGDSHIVLGQTSEARYLLIAIKYLGSGAARVITARDMTKKEIRRYKR
ncbi:BrnT family toxin [candidate division CSSED10-310 bacterium]|uniref:BrnT family toxin n=1 Tax=candidate division CSSED10-310 bacterium TaxID=2855610 RepID=A0ABV6Z3P0_UNCC1